MNPNEDPNSPENQQKVIDFLLHGALTRMSVEIEVQRELLCSILATQPSIMQGKDPQDYIQSKIQERLNPILAGAADISPSAASALANLLLRAKKDQQAE